MTRLPAQLALARVLLLAGVLHLHRLGDTPINISTDEARFAVQAHAIAPTGREPSTRQAFGTLNDLNDSWRA